MALNPTGIMSIGGPVTGSSINLELGLSATANSNMNQANFRTLAGIPSGVITLSNFYGKSNGTQKAIFGYGFSQPPTVGRTLTNLVTNVGIVGADVPGVGTQRQSLAAGSYGGDKAIFGYGSTTPASTANMKSLTNKVSNTGVVAADTPGVGTARSFLGCAGYGTDKVIFAFGGTVTPGTTNTSVVNLVANTGVVATDTPTVATAKRQHLGVTYGGDKAIIAYGAPGTATQNLVSNTGVVAANTSCAGTLRINGSASSYGGDKAIIAFGQIPSALTNLSNLISNTGVIAADTPGVGTARSILAGAGYGGDKGIFAYGSLLPATQSMSNLVSNTGVVASDTPGVGTTRGGLAAAGYSFS